MRRLSAACRAPAWLLPMLLLVAGTTPLDAQPVRDFHEGMRLGVGYAGSLPHAPYGASVFHLFGGRIGAFADAKFVVPTLRGHENYCPAELTQCTTAWVETERNDQRIRAVDEFLLLNLGGIYALTNEFAVAVGGGLARRTTVTEFFHAETDPNVRITESGSYFVAADPEREWMPNAVLGMMLRAGRSMVFRFGYETAPGGIGVGVYFVLP